MLIVEDDAFTRTALMTVVTSLGHQVVGQAATVIDTMDAARATTPDVVLIDLDLGAGPTGIDAAYGLRGLLPDVGIVVLSSYADARVMGRRARPMPPGAMFISKRDLSDLAPLDRALQSAASGGVSPSEVAARAADLTDGQLELLRLVASGLSNDEIARRLWLTEPSVRRSITRLLRKLDIEPSDARNARVQLVRVYTQLAGQPVHDE